MPSVPIIAPELMAPAGDWDCAKAAVENGADAVYFGLQDGFNARTRASNFALDDLPRLMTFFRTRGVKGYLTLNTLVFADELEQAERVARKAVSAGVDAVLIQDIGLLRLIHRLCPELPLHASTQMTLSSVECIREIELLGVRRVVLPRELSIDQIASIHQQTGVELETFVHGALCISYSGQCLASLSMGGRSANRGQCAQPCRLPYEALCDGRPVASAMRYPLSPHDLAAYDRLPELIAAGVRALKIEGRLKPPEYVASVTRCYRSALDDNSSIKPRPAVANQGATTGRGFLLDVLKTEQIAEMETIFSRGFCHGWLDGDDRQTLVSGQSSDKRGILVGEVRGVRGSRILVELAAPVRRGDGLVFEGEQKGAIEQGGRVYEIFQNNRSIEKEVTDGQVDLTFRYGAIDFANIFLGQKVWKTDDPQAVRRLRKTYSGVRSQRRVPLDLTIEAAVGRPMQLSALAATGAACRFESPEPLAEATKHPLTPETLTEQFGRLGNTPYELRRLDAKIEGRPMIPLSVLGKLRRELVQRLESAASQIPLRAMSEQSALSALRVEDSESAKPQAIAAQNHSDPQASPITKSQIHVLCRSLEQIEAALACGASSIIADLRDMNHCGHAVRTVRSGGATILLATPRIHKPGESGVFELFARAEPDGILVRNLAGLAFYRPLGLSIVADFSLNAVNDLTIRWLHAQGAERVTAAYDLSGPRLLDLAARVPAEWLEVVVHRHTPMFHSEYCLFQGILSHGASRRDCGRPCVRHEVRLRDRLGVEHRLLPDGQCRNTLFHAEAVSLSPLMPELRSRGACHFRVELLNESSVAEVRQVVARYINNRMERFDAATT